MRAKSLWVKINRRKRVSRLKIPTCNARTLLRHEHIHELEEELRETWLVWEVIGVSEVRIPEKCFITLHSGHLLCNSKENNGQAGIGFLKKKKDHYSEGKQFQSSRTVFMHNKALHTKYSASICTNDIPRRIHK